MVSQSVVRSLQKWLPLPELGDACADGIHPLLLGLCVASLKPEVEAGTLHLWRRNSKGVLSRAKLAQPRAARELQRALNLVVAREPEQ